MHTDATLAVHLQTPNSSRMLIGVCTMAFLLGCNPDDDKGAKTPPNLARDTEAFIAGICTRLQWDATCPVWPRTDDQRFADTSNVYGPLAFITPAPVLDTLQTDAAFIARPNGVLVGAIAIEQDPALPGPLPKIYQNLSVSYDLNCIYLFAAQGGTAWTASVASVPQGQKCPASSPANNNLKVLRVTKPGQPSAAVPAVARFHEGVGVGGLPQPLFGLKCANAWCMILPNTADTVGIKYPASDAGWLTWQVHGWHDEQHLALKDSLTKKLTYGRDLRASIAAHPKLGSYVFANGIHHVATVHFHDDPANTTYDKRWGFVQGPNQVFLGKNASGAWEARVGNKVVNVERMGHGFFPPAAARFRWDENDEGLWVRCDDGCCKVSGT